MLSSLKKCIGHRSPLRLGWHQLKAFLAALRFGFPAKKLAVIGITGTDGKTTTVAMTAHILHLCAVPVGAVSTSFLRIKGSVRENPTHKTSLSPFALQKFLRECLDAGCTTVIVECSSHGLVQHRLDFLWPKVAAITNTSPEHLDYHGTMEQYRADKAILFEMLGGKGIKVLNADDGTYEMYRKISSAKTVTFACDKGHGTRDNTIHFWAMDIAATSAKTTADIHHSLSPVPCHISLPIPGDFNLENALCAVACATCIGVPVHQSAEALKTFTGVAGRLEKIDEGQNFSVYVDFTVTPRSYEVTLDAIRETLPPEKHLLVLTGSCGDRMREKRPQIGKICSERADTVVVTEDETLTEDPMKVIDEVFAGIDQSKTSAHKIPDRREAIRFLFKEAKPGDAVILCGMGSCTTMQTREGLKPWDERKVARELLQSLKI